MTWDVTCDRWAKMVSRVLPRPADRPPAALEPATGPRAEAPSAKALPDPSPPDRASA